MKKLLILGLSILLVVGCNNGKKEESGDGNKDGKGSVMDLEQYSYIKVEDIESISVIKYTEGGDDRKDITTKDEIEKEYNKLKKLEVGEEVSTTCDDNTTLYIFKLKDGSSPSVEIECDWFVIDNKRYEIVK